LPHAILALNAGSSSLKLAVFEVARDGALTRMATGQLEGVGTAPHFAAHAPDGTVLAECRWTHGQDRSHEDFLQTILDFAEHALGRDTLAAVGHRVVHGGADHVTPQRVTKPLFAALDALVPLAPLHLPHSLAPMRALAALRPHLKQFACFDTAFHSTIPALATRLPIPRALHDEGVRRYGFHGLSYEHIAATLAERAPHLAAGRVIAAHLGNGASLCAMQSGKSIDTSMGFTALDGLMMGTRCGSIDPGVILYLLQQRGMSAHDVEHLLYHRSGLLSVSGISGDMRALIASADPRAAEARALYVLRIVREAGALTALLGGLDGFVFTAGIGEHDPDLRADVCARLNILLDPASNAIGHGRISAEGSAIEAWVMPTDEEKVIARHTADALTHTR
jgi:acetate kinase